MWEWGLNTVLLENGLGLQNGFRVSVITGTPFGGYTKEEKQKEVGVEGNRAENSTETTRSSDLSVYAASSWPGRTGRNTGQADRWC